MNMQPIRIILADDHPLFTSGLAGLIEKEEDMCIVLTVSNGNVLLHALREKEADMVVMDINMPGMNGMDALQKVKQLYPAIKVIMLSTYAEAHLVEKTEKAGADGYVVKSADIPSLFEAIRSVANGEKSFPNKARPATTDESGFTRQFFLTRREKEIIELIGQNFTNQQIAERLFLSVYTIETHRKNIMEKLGLKKPLALMQFIMENNLSAKPA